MRSGIQFSYPREFNGDGRRLRTGIFVGVPLAFGELYKRWNADPVAYYCPEWTSRQSLSFTVVGRIRLPRSRS